METGIIVTLGVIVFLKVLVWERFQAWTRHRRLAPLGPGPEVTAEPPLEPPDGYRLDRETEHWTLTREASGPPRIRLEIRHERGEVPTGELTIGFEDTKASPLLIAYVTEGTGFEWTGTGWRRQLSWSAGDWYGAPTTMRSLYQEGVACLRTAEALHRRALRTLSFAPEELEAIESRGRGRGAGGAAAGRDVTPGDEPMTDPAVLASLAQRLVVDIAPVDPELALFVARHMDSPIIWLVFIEWPAATVEAYAALFHGAAGTPFETAVMERALADPLKLGPAMLEALFEALARRGDDRLGPLLLRMLSELSSAFRPMLVGWLERHGDPSALIPLTELLTYCAPDLTDNIQRALTAIRFRHAATLDQRVGALAVEDPGGALAMVEREAVER